MTSRTHTSRYPFNQFTFSWLIFLLVLPSIRLSGQCGAPEQLPSLTCEEAPLICLANLCNEGFNIPLNGYVGFCGPNTAVHNPQYYQFIPVSEDVEISINVISCSGGNGLQSAIIGACPWTVSDVIACDPGAPPGGVMELHVSGLVIGQLYWLLIDGSAGSVCEYMITTANGIFAPELTGEISAVIAEADTVVQGHEDLILEAIGSVGSAHGYYWVLGWSNDTITSTLPSLSIDIHCSIPPGTYSICARAFSGCDTTDLDVCTTLEILPQENVIKDPATFCPDEFPFQWFDQVISGPGTYTQNFENPFSCPHDSTWQIAAYAALPDGNIDTARCASGFFYQGQFYDTSGTYILQYPGQGLNGCDSVAYLHLAIDNGNFFIETLCTDTQFTLRPVVITHTSSSDTIAFAWFDCNYDSLLSTSERFTPDTSGCYCLVLNHGFCMDTICSTYALNPCTQPCSLIGQSVCSQDSVLFTYDGELPAGAILHWLIDLPGSAENYFTGTDSVFLHYDTTGCFRVSLTIVDSSMTVTCVDSFCIEQSEAIASVCCNQSKCDSCATITIEMSGTPPWTLHIDDGYKIDTISGITFSPYLHTVCPPSDSATTYSFQIYNNTNSCPGEFMGDNYITIALSTPAEATIAQLTDTLCAHPAGMAAYNWFTCNLGPSLTTAQCLQPEDSGCYCVEITTQGGCKDTTCYDFVISAIPTLEESLLTISPIPSAGSWDIAFVENIVFPVEWSLMDPWGRLLESGILSHSSSKIQLNEIPSSGVYFLKFLSGAQQSLTIKVAIQSN